MTENVTAWDQVRAVVLSVLAVTAVLTVATVEPAAAAGNTAEDGFVYVDAGDGYLKSVQSNGTVTNYTTSDVTVIGPRADIDNDGKREVPYITSNGVLEIRDDGGETQQLGDFSSVSPRTSKSKLAIGDWDGDGNYDVFFASQESQRNIYRIDWDERDSEPENLGLFDADAAQFMLGSTDITGDGLRDLVFVTSSSSLYYVNGSGNDVKLTGSTKWGANGNIGLGEPEDLDDSGGSDPSPGDYNYPMAGSSGEVQVLANDPGLSVRTLIDGSEAKKTAPTGADWTGDGVADHIYIAEDGYVNYTQHDSVGSDAGRALDENSNRIAADATIGLTSRITSFEDRESLSSSGANADETPPSVTVNQPNGGETLSQGDTYTIKWDASDGETGVASDGITLEYSTDNGTTWETIAADEANDGTYDWTVPSADTDRALVRVNATDDAGNTGSDESDGTFTITDTTAPSYLSGYPATGNATDDGFDVDVAADEDGTAYYVVLQDGATAPNASQVRDGLDGDGNPAEAADSGAITANTERTFTASGLDADTPYDVYTVAEDGAGNTNRSARVDQSTATDDTAPSYLAGYPNAGNATTDGFDINVSADENATAYHVVLQDGATAPTVSDVKAEQDGDGNPAVAAANDTITANADRTFTASGLSEDTPYDVYVVVEDSAGNANLSARIDQRTAADTTPPTVLSDTLSLGNDGNDDLVFGFDTDEQLGANATDLAVSVDGPNTADVYSFDRTDFAETDNGDGTFTYELTTTQAYDDGDGTYTVSVDDALDAAGNDGADGTDTDSYTLDTTAPTVDSTSVALGEDADGNLTFGFDTDEQLGTDASALAVSVDGPSTAGVYSFDRTDFAETDNGDGTFTYTLDAAQPYDDGDGTYEASVDDALDAAGNDGADGSDADSYTFDGTAPSVSGYDVTNPDGGNVTVTFDTDEQLADVAVDISGAETATLSTSEFTESESGGTYTYEGTYQAGTDGDYTATLTTAADAAGNDGASDQSGTVTVDATPPTVSNYSVSNPADTDVRVAFETDEQLSTLSVNVSGAESATLSASDFTESASGGTYTYEGTYQGTTDGDYTATLETAADAAGNDGADGQSGTVTAGSPTIPTAAFTVEKTDADDVAVEFESDEQLVDIEVVVDGPETATLTETTFEESTTADGNYTYGTVYETAETGVFTATLTTAANADGADGAANQTGTTGLNARPTASSYLVGVDSDVALSGERTEVPDGVTPSYEWDLDGDGTADRTGENITASFASPGDTQVELTVSGDGNVSTDTLTVTVEDRTAPTASLAGGDTTVSEGTTVQFDASGSTDNVGVDAYEWDLDGDGTTDATGATASRTYDEPGTYTAAVTVSDAAGNDVTARRTVEVSGPDAGDLASSLTYGDTATNTTTVRSVTVSNDGTAPLNVSDVSLSGTDTAAYDLGDTAANAPVVVAPGESVSLSASFAPATTGTKTATLSLDTNDTDTGTASVALEGTGVDTDLVVNDSSREFGAVDTGETETVAVAVTNDGGAPADVTTVEVTGGAADQFTVTDADGLPDTIAAGETRTIDVTFEPGTTGTLSASLALTTEDGTPVSVALTGTGRGPDAHLPDEGLAFGELGTTETATETLTVSNHGDQTLAVDTAAVTGRNDSSFAVQSAPSTVPAGESATVEVTYDPAGAGDHGARLELASDDPDEPVVTAPLNGSAVAADIGVDRQSLNFGNVTVGETTFLNITVENLATSKADLTVEETPVVGTNPEDFAVNRGGAPFTLAPGESRDIEVAFTPSTQATKQAQLFLHSDAGNEPQISVWLSNDETYVVVQQVDEGLAENATVNVDANNVGTESFDVNVSQPGPRAEAVGFEGLEMAVDGTDSYEINLTHADGPPTANSATYDPDEDRQTLQYVRLNHSVDADTTYDDTAVKYRVDKAALPDGTDPDEVTLNRWNGSAWNYSASGTLVRETDGHYVYRVETPGFSQFVVTGPESGPDDDSGGSGGSGGGSGTGPSAVEPVEPEPSASDLSVVGTELGTATVAVAEDVDVTATVRNDGDASGEFTVVLSSDGEQVAQRTVSLDAGETDTVSFDSSFAAPGEYTLTVEDAAVGTVTVESADEAETSEAAQPTTSTPTETATESPAAGDGGEDGQTATGTWDWLGVPLVWLVPGLLGLLLLLLLLWRRRDEDEEEEAPAAADD